jgi:predicted nuclease of predicted toxin-antitoxin system
VIIWIDAQLSPALAAWINRTFEDIEAKSVRSMGLRDAEDDRIFRLARDANVIVMTKDSDFPQLLKQHGPPPKVLWLTCGNTSNNRMREILSRMLLPALDMLRDGQALIEIGDAE